MQSEYRKRCLVLLGLGILLMALAFILVHIVVPGLGTSAAPETLPFVIFAVGALAGIAGSALYLVAWAYYAKSKGYAPALGLLACGILPLLVLWLLPDRTKRGISLEDASAFGLRIRLGTMMFMQYAIWGAWAPVLWPYLVGASPGGLGLSSTQAALLFGLLPLACILAPFTGGQVADRWVPTQWFLGAVQLVGGVLLFAASRAHSLGSVMLVFGLYCLLYAPTLALTNSLAFHHLKDEKTFGGIRVWGTIGWIVAGLYLTAWRKFGVPPGIADSLMLAGIFSVAMGVFCFFLPHTPPSKDKAADPLAFREAFVLLKNANFLVFMLIAFVVTTELQFYYLPTADFLNRALKIDPSIIPATMTVAQAAEILALAIFLPLSLHRLGVRKTLAIGVIAWPLRYIVFAAAPYGPIEIMRPLVIVSLTFHGLGYAFFFVASQIFVDMVATKDIRASAQSLLTLVTLGVGTWLGMQFTGYILGSAYEVHNWTRVFLVPCALTVACAIAFLLFFKDPEKTTAPAAAEPVKAEA
jgi:nucleoside transporter